MTDSADGERFSGRDAYHGARLDPHSRGTRPRASPARTPTWGHTLQVLSLGQGRATTHVVISC
jgi:hypothetical protein